MYHWNLQQAQRAELVFLSGENLGEQGEMSDKLILVVVDGVFRSDQKTSKITKISLAKI